MPSVAEIQRLAALLERLAPLSTKQRGELIEADDWNVLVGALIEVGRAALATGESDTIAAHEHPDQVGIGWLDPRVRQLVTGGGVKDPAVETGFFKIRRDLGALTTRLDKVGGDVASSRARIDEVATKDLVRETTLTRLNRKVLGAADDRGDIADLRGTLRTLETEVARAVEVGGRLEVDGEPVDIAGLVRRVGEVEILRDRLTQPSGELLDASVFERRLLELEATLVTEGDLTDAIDDLRGRGGGDFDLGSVLDAARDASRETASATVGSLGTELRSELAGRFEEIGPVVDASVNVAVERATTSLADEILSEARSDFGEAMGEVETSVRSDLQALLEEGISATTENVNARLAEIPAVVGAEVARELDSALIEVTGRLDGLSEEVGGLGGRVTTNAGTIADVNTAFEGARRDDAAARASLRTEVLGRITEVEGQIDGRIRVAVDDARTILRTDLEGAVGAARRDLEVRLAAVAREAAITEVRVLSTGLRTDMQSLVREEIDGSLVDIRTEISGEVTGLRQRVSGMVANEVARASADIPNLVREEFETFRPEINRIVDTRISRPPIR